MQQNEIIIWTASLTLNSEQRNQYFAVLSQDEKERAMQFKTSELQSRFIASRAILRQLLSQYLEVKPEAIKFAYTKAKKPYLLFPKSHLQFNLSHSEDFLALAFTKNHAIGIDTEKLRSSYNPALVKRYYSDRERVYLENLPEKKRIQAFFYLWARKEALIKAIGKGISTSMLQLSVLNHSVSFRQQRWNLLTLPLNDNFETAIASNQTIHNIKCWNYSDHHQC